MDETFYDIFLKFDEEINSHKEVIERENEKDFPSRDNIAYHSACIQGLSDAKGIVESQII